MTRESSYSQHYARMATTINADASGNGGPAEAAAFLATMFAGMGDECDISPAADGSVAIDHRGLRVIRGLEYPEQELLLACWVELWRGAVNAHRQFMDVQAIAEPGVLHWRIAPSR